MGCYYFSAHWCGYCKYLLPKLTEIYKTANQEDPDTLEVVFLSGCNDQAGFDSYYPGDHPWLAVPYFNSVGDVNTQGVGFVRKAKQEAGIKKGTLQVEFKVNTIPT